MFNKSKNLIFYGKDYKLIISKKILEKFNKNIKKNKTESGGIILGNIYSSYSVVKKVTIPNKFDKAGFNYFVRSKIIAQQRINSMWEKSYGIINYIGEWHTHFILNPKPSYIDKNMIKRMLNTTKMEINFLFLIIIGLNNTYWVGRQTERGLEEYKIEQL